MFGASCNDRSPVYILRLGKERERDGKKSKNMEKTYDFVKKSGPEDLNLKESKYECIFALTGSSCKGSVSRHRSFLPSFCPSSKRWPLESVSSDVTRSHGL